MTKKLKTHDDVKSDRDTGYYINLEKLVGKKVKEIQGHVSTEFDSDSPCFQLYRIIFEDGTNAFVEGEHDIAYLPEVPGVSDKEMKNIYKTGPYYYPSEEEGSEDE